MTLQIDSRGYPFGRAFSRDYRSHSRLRRGCRRHVTGCRGRGGGSHAGNDFIGDARRLLSVPFRPAVRFWSFRRLGEFNRDILGILVQTSSLDATDALLDALATTYQLDDFRGVEGPGFEAEGVTVNDIVTLSADFRTVRFDFSTTSRLDEIRVITAVPEPAALGFIVIGVVGLLADRRKRSAL